MRIGGHWIHDIDPILLHFPSFWPIPGIYWYGFAYLLTFLIIAFALRIYARLGRLPFPREQIGPFLGYLILGAMAGGRIGYALLYGIPGLREDPLELLRVWHGGMASHGGFFGVLLALLLFSRKCSIPLGATADLVSSLAPIGFFLGRIANFINGEVYGRVSSLPWAVIFPGAEPTLPLERILPRHPSQLYEALLEGLLLFLFCQLRFWRRPPLRPGRLCGEFLVTYALLRFAVEFFREPDAPTILGLSRGQFYSIALLIAALPFLLPRRRSLR
ncbi:MAG: prolipoprotein diacylglyceryl transferase [Puniceicoccales bacterium]|jgi:phosphatidylglycerol:prolipoprotein diacylglycerol transferase|nr:prolipoprotein diacylglyceryl transferase [Puniceicoccales bacterium]